MGGGGGVHPILGTFLFSSGHFTENSRESARLSGVRNSGRGVDVPLSRCRRPPRDTGRSPVRVLPHGVRSVGSSGDSQAPGSRRRFTESGPL